GVSSDVNIIPANWNCLSASALAPPRDAPAKVLTIVIRAGTGGACLTTRSRPPVHPVRGHVGQPHCGAGGARRRVCHLRRPIVTCILGSLEARSPSSSRLPP